MKSEPGTYALVMQSTREQSIAVGALGEMIVRSSVYVYVGSAFGPGGVRARVQRHLSAGGARHWHVDYLRAVTTVEEVWYTHDTLRRECLWGSILREGDGASVPLSGFGASDCDCIAHLVEFESRPRIQSFRAAVKDAENEHAPISVLDRAETLER